MAPYLHEVISPIPQPCDACNFQKLFNSALDGLRSPQQQQLSQLPPCWLRSIARSSHEINRKHAANELQTHRILFLTEALVRCYLGFIWSSILLIYFGLGITHDFVDQLCALSKQKWHQEIHISSDRETRYIFCETPFWKPIQVLWGRH